MFTWFYRSILSEYKTNLKHLFTIPTALISPLDLESVLTVLGGIERIRQRGSSESEDGGTAPVHERSHELLVRSLGERSEPRHDNLLLVRGQVASDLRTFIFPKAIKSNTNASTKPIKSKGSRKIVTTIMYIAEAAVNPQRVEVRRGSGWGGRNKEM